MLKEPLRNLLDDNTGHDYILKEKNITCCRHVCIETSSEARSAGERVNAKRRRRRKLRHDRNWEMTLAESRDTVALLSFMSPQIFVVFLASEYADKSNARPFHAACTAVSTKTSIRDVFPIKIARKP